MLGTIKTPWYFYFLSFTSEQNYVRFAKAVVELTMIVDWFIIYNNIFPIKNKVFTYYLQNLWSHCDRPCQSYLVGTGQSTITTSLHIFKVFLMHSTMPWQMVVFKIVSFIIKELGFPYICSSYVFTLTSRNLKMPLDSCSQHWVRKFIVNFC